jgi:hypothetical protein
METIKGTLFLYSETGTEGGYWAIQDEKFIGKRDDGSPYWSYDGLHPLEDGDHLKIYHPDGILVWEGEIKLKQHPVFTESVDVHDESSGVNLGLWIHADQIGMSRHDWAYPFMKEYKGELTKHGK